MVRLGLNTEASRNDVHPENAETSKIGQDEFREATRRNDIHPEDADARKIGQAGFREGSRRNRVHADDAETLVRLALGKDREQITYILRLRR